MCLSSQLAGIGNSGRHLNQIYNKEKVKLKGKLCVLKAFSLSPLGQVVSPEQCSFVSLMACSRRGIEIIHIMWKSNLCFSSWLKTVLSIQMKEYFMMVANFTAKFALRVHKVCSTRQNWISQRSLEGAVWFRACPALFSLVKCCKQPTLLPSPPILSIY